MTMPKAAMNKDNLASTRQTEIGRPREALVVKPKSISKRIHQSAHCHFRSAVARAYFGHRGASFRGSDYIDHVAPYSVCAIVVVRATKGRPFDMFKTNTSTGSGKIFDSLMTGGSPGSPCAPNRSPSASLCLARPHALEQHPRALCANARSGSRI
jgi:hypothetical protein